MRREVVTRLPMSWDARALHGEETYELYRQNMADLYAVEGVGPAARKRFYNSSSMALTAMGVVGHGQSSGQVMQRSRSYVGRSEIDGLNLLVNMAPIVGDCAGRSVRAAAGDVQLRDLSRETRSHVTKVDVYTLLIPRRHVPALLLERGAHGAVLGQDTPAGRLISGHIRILGGRLARLDDAQRLAGVTAALAMTARAMGDTRPLDPETRAALRLGLRWRAERLIAERLMDPDLDADALARACGGSRATLYRAFDADGGVHRFIQKRRLEHAHQVLMGRRDQSVADIAYDHGFTSQPHFSRVFRGVFGYSPSDVRPFVTGNDDTPPARPGRMRHDLMVGWLKSLAAAG
jgi:AraC-like DNA-binding protein